MENFSLLYPPDISLNSRHSSSKLHSAAWHDLGIEQVVAAFTGDKDHQKDIQEIFAQLIHDPEVIRYRQDILDDLLRNPELVDRLTSLLPVIDSLARFSFRSEQEVNRESLCPENKALDSRNILRKP